MNATSGDGGLSTASSSWQSISLIISVFFYAMSFESMLRGLGCSIHQLWARSDGRFLPGLIAGYNVAAIIQTMCVMAFFSGVIQQGACGMVGFMGYGFYHVNMIAFSLFLLYRTYFVCSQNQIFLVLAVITMANRIGWALYDVATSHTVWMDEYQFCNLDSNTFVLTAYLASDMVTDILCTVATVMVSFRYVKTDLRKLFLVLVLENVIRTMFVSAIQAVSVWCNITQQDPTWANVIAGIETYVVTQAINSEFWWFQARNKALGDDFKLALEQTEDSNKGGSSKS